MDITNIILNVFGYAVVLFGMVFIAIVVHNWKRSYEERKLNKEKEQEHALKKNEMSVTKDRKD